MDKLTIYETMKETIDDALEWGFECESPMNFVYAIDGIVSFCNNLIKKLNNDEAVKTMLM